MNLNVPQALILQIIIQIYTIPHKEGIHATVPPTVKSKTTEPQDMGTANLCW